LLLARGASFTTALDAACRLATVTLERLIEQVDNIVTASDDQPVIARHDASSKPPRESQEIPVRHLTSRLRLPQFDHGCGRYRVRPEHMAGG
jgi:hypothetical protein